MSTDDFTEDFAETSSPRPHHPGARRRLDVQSLALLVVALVSAGWCCWFIAHDRLSWLILTPSIVPAAASAAHLTKMEAPRDDQ